MIYSAVGRLLPFSHSETVSCDTASILPNSICVSFFSVRISLTRSAIFVSIPIFYEEYSFICLTYEEYSYIISLMEEKETDGTVVPYIDFRLYNAARVGYELECNEVRRRFAGGSPYELKKALGKIIFKPPHALYNGETYYLVGYFVPRGAQPEKEQIALIYCVFHKKDGEIFAVKRGADGLYRACGYEPADAEEGSLHTVVKDKLGSVRRVSALKKLLGLCRR